MPVSEKTARMTILGVISWLSVCLLTVGLFPEVTASMKWVWSVAGLFGLASAVGLSEALKVENRDQQELLSKFARAAKTDALTGLGNRRALREELDYWQAHWQAGRDFSLLLVDVDHFKAFNDAHGHAGGDNMLCVVADLLRRTVTTVGTATRFGGEEFAILLPMCDLEAAQAVAERIRRKAGSLTMSVTEGQVGVTVSVGVAQAEQTEDARQLLIRADEQLYAAKQAGRNCIRPELTPAVMLIESSAFVLEEACT